MNASFLRSARHAALGLLTLALPLAAHAQTAPKIFVSLKGDDSAAGSLGAPKRNFQAAHDAVAPGGEIVVLTTAGYGTLNITKSVAITVPPGVTGFITAAGGANGVTINAAATDIVTLRGIIIEGNDPTVGTGIDAEAVGTLYVDTCTVRSFRTAILNNANGGKLEVSNSNVRDSGDGVYVAAGGDSSTARTNVVGCKIDNIINSGVYSYVGSNGTAVTTATNCVISHCGRGAYAFNTGAVVYLDGCILSGDATAVTTTGSGQVVSRVSNTLFNNTDDGTFSGTLAAQ